MKDNMQINSRLLTGIISKFVSKILKQKIGSDVIIKIDKIQFSLTDEGRTQIYMELGAECETKELAAFLGKMI